VEAVLGERIQSSRGPGPGGRPLRPSVPQGFPRGKRCVRAG